MRRLLALTGITSIATSFAVLTAVPLAAAARTVSPERWVRTVCSAWTGYTDAVDDMYLEVEEISVAVEDRALETENARRRAVSAQAGLLAEANGVVRAVQQSADPEIENGANVRRNYLETVKEYRRSDRDVLAAFRRLPVGSAAKFLDGFFRAGADGGEAWDVIGYNPLEELKAAPELAAAIDGELACQRVDAWFDLGYLSDVMIGECFDADWETVGCNRPHHSELFLQTEHPAARGEPYPGQAAIDAYAEEQCAAAFAGYAGRDLASSSLSITYFTPDQQAWKANDREILCVVGNPDGSPRTGSVRVTAI